MNKKEYTKPLFKAIELECSDILVNSGDPPSPLNDLEEIDINDEPNTEEWA